MVPPGSLSSPPGRAQGPSALHPRSVRADDRPMTDLMRAVPTRQLVIDSTGSAVRSIDAVRVFGEGPTEVRALDGITVGFERARFTSIMGPSGSGKSTLMHCLAGLDQLTSGRVLLGDTDLGTLSEVERTELRRDRVGFVFQAFNLVPTLTAEANILLPLRLAGQTADPAWFKTVTEGVGIDDRLHHRPGELSGGQQQKVACARALVSRPDVVFADEPTGNLDSTASAQVLGFLRQAVDEYGQTVVLVSHDPHAAAMGDRIVFLADGRLAGEMLEPEPEAVIDTMKLLGR